MDYLQELEKYKDFKDVKDLVDDVHKLRKYYFTGQYDAMQQHINNITIKYFQETIVWNSANRTMPTNPNELYRNAENFLKMKGFFMLMQKGIQVHNQLTQQELDFIQNWMKL